MKRVLMLGTVLALLVLSPLGCQGTHHVDVARSEFVNGSPKHPALYDTLWSQLVECFGTQYGKTLPAVPLDSAVHAWYIVDAADSLGNYCRRTNGEPASACWDVNRKYIALARPAINTWTEPLHEMGHAAQAAYSLPGEGPPDPYHGEKFQKCVSRR